MDDYLAITDNDYLLELVTGMWSISSYAPETPELSVAEIESSTLDGGAVGAITRRNVTESATLRLQGTSQDDMQLALQQLEQKLRYAEEVSTYVHFRAHGVSGELYRSKILTGFVTLDAEQLDWGRWEQGIVYVTVTWTRQYFWESVSEKQLLLTNRYGTAQESLRVDNGWDADTAIAGETGPVGNGVLTSFSWSTVESPIVPTGFSVSIRQGGLTRVGTANAAGTITGTGITSGSVNFTTGAVTLVLSTAQDNTIAITTTYTSRGRDNTINLLPGQVAGVLPAPVRMEILNTGPVSGSRHANFWIGGNVFSDPANWVTALEAEDSTGGGSVTTSDRTYSSRKYRTKVMVGDTEQVAFQWTLSTAMLDRANGARFAVMARLISGWNGWRVRIRILQDITTLWDGPAIRILDNGTMHDLGFVRLPPMVGSPSYYPLVLQILVRKTGGGTLVLDDLHLLPTQGFRKLYSLGYNLDYLTRLMINELTGEFYTDLYTPAGKGYTYIVAGSPLMVWPGVAQRFAFMWSSDLATSSIQRQCTIKLFYRPRRLTV